MSVATPEEAAEGMRERYSTVRMAQDMAWDHAMDHPEGSERDYWVKVHHLLGGRRTLGQESLRQNKKARSIGRRSAMDTRFGEDIEDPDALPVESGRQLDKAMNRYETFHAKKPMRLIELEHELPHEWKLMGDALAVMYRTDKWKKDGTDEDYKHLHDAGDDKPYPVNRGVRFYEPASSGQKLPVARPSALALLGYCLGAFVRQDDGETYETNPRGCYLFSSPSGDLLLIYSPDKQPDGSSGFLAAMAGANLRVLKDGIDG